MKKRSRLFKFLVLFLGLMLAWIMLAPFLANYLIVEKPVEKADAILVLGGSAVYIERTQKAAALYKEGRAPKILLTDDGEQGGWSKQEQRNPFFVELARNNLIAAGVPAENIEILEPQVTGTIYEAQVLKKTIIEHGYKSVLLVTSAYHTRRALWTFERVLADQTIEIGIASPPPGEQTPPPFSWWVKKEGWRLVAAEYVKSVYYRLYY